MQDWADDVRALGIEWDMLWTARGNPDLMTILQKMNELVWSRWNNFTIEQKQEAFMLNEWEVLRFDPRFVEQLRDLAAITEAQESFLQLLKAEEAR